MTSNKDLVSILEQRLDILTKAITALNEISMALDKKRYKILRELYNPAIKNLLHDYSELY